MYHYHHTFPCFHCHPHDYIQMVQHLIERCLLLGMDQDQCIKALAEHARVRPLVTLAVWRELLKENRHFFTAYFQNIHQRQSKGRRSRKARFAGRKSWRW